MSSRKNHLTRRDFIDSSVKGLVGYTVVKNGLIHARPSDETKSRVVIVTDEQVTSRNKIKPGVAQAMMDSGIISLTGIANVGEAWRSLFPDITQQKVIGIKVNCINSALSSHPEIAQCIVNGLSKMQVEGQFFPQENIIIWDRTSGELQDAGYQINKSATGVKCYGTGSYSDATFKVFDRNIRISKILTEKCDYLINLCVPKDHGTTGVTLSMKNHYGTCNNPGDLHGSSGSKYIPALNCLDPIRLKQKIVICDAIWAIVSGGPGGTPKAQPRKLVFSLDPVALDYTCAQILMDFGMGQWALNTATHIKNAANSPYNLGTNDPNKMEVIEVDNPSTQVAQDNNDFKLPDSFHLFQNFPNPFNSQTTITFTVTPSRHVHIDIYDIRGNLVHTLADGFYHSGYYSVHWDGKTTQGIPAASGAYLCHLTGDDFSRTIKMHYIR